MACIWARPWPRGEQLQWIRLEIGIRQAEVPDLKELKIDGPVDFEPVPSSDFRTYVVLTVFGKRFKSTSATGHQPSYQGPYLGKFVAEIPLPVGEKGICALDMSELGIDIVEQDALDSEQKRTIWACKMPLWKVFTVEEEIVKVEPPPTALTNLVGDNALTTLGLKEEVQEQAVKSLRETMHTGARKNVKRMWLMHPTAVDSEAPLKAYLDLEVSGKVAASSLLPRTCISPEMQGRGSTVNLFTSHKALDSSSSALLKHLLSPF